MSRWTQRAPLWLTVVLAACNPHTRRDAADLPTAVPEKFSGPAEGGVQLPPRWWTAFGDGQLDALMERVFAGNLDLQQAWARLGQAEAAAGIAGATRVPQVTATAGSGRARGYSPVSGDPQTSNNHRVSVGATYEIDAWGRLAALAKAAALDAQATRLDVEALAITLSAQVAETWFTLVELRARRDLLARQTEVNRQLQELVELRFEQGLVSAVDVYQQRQVLLGTQSQLPLVDAQLAVVANRVALLEGRAPGAGGPDAAPPALPALPDLPAAGIPSELLERRPDIRSAKLRVTAADERLGAAVADQFPSIRLDASAGFGAENLNELVDRWVWNIAGNMVMPLFDGGRRKAEVARQRATLRERLGGLAKTILGAFAEVEDALIQERQQAAYLRELQSQLEVSASLLSETRNRYTEGLIEYLPVLTAVRAHQQAELALLAAHRQQLSLRVQLCRALGGDWTADLRDPVARADSED